MGEHLLCPQGNLRGPLGRQRQHLMHRVGVQRIGATKHGGHGFIGRAGDVVLHLLAGQGHAGGLRVEAEHPGPGVPRTVSVAHDSGPDPAGGPELCDLLEEVHVRVEKKGEPWRELVDLQSGLDRRLNVRHPVGQGEGELLSGGGARFPDVIARDGYRVPARHVAGGEHDRVGHQPHRRLGREDVFLLCDVLLENVVLQGPAELRRLEAFLLPHGDVHGVEDRRRRVDRHRGGDLVELDVVEERLHVFERIDRNAAMADLALTQGIIGVVAHQGRHVEGHGEAGLALLEQELVTAVRLSRRAVAGKLPDGP